MKKYTLILLASLVIHSASWSQSIIIGPEGSKIFAFDVTKDKEHAIVAFDGGLGLLNLRKGHFVDQYRHHSIIDVTTLELTTDSSYVFFGTTSGKVSQLSLAQREQKTLIEGEQSITCLKVISPERVLIGTEGGQLILWNPKENKRITQRNLSKAITAIAHDSENNDAFILTLDGKIRILTLKNEISIFEDLNKPAFDMAYISKNKLLNVATNSALFTLKRTNKRWNQISKESNSIWAVCTTNNDQLKSPAVVYMNGLVKVFSNFATYKYKLPVAPLAIDYALDTRDTINLLILGMDLKLYLIRSDDWKMKT